MRNTLETRLGLFFALAAIAAVVIIEMLGGLSFFKPGRLVRARFNTVQDLKMGDPVKMGGVEVGRVEQIQLEENKVVVTMKIDEQAQVKTDSVASIKFLGLMGQNYVSLTFGSPQAPLAVSGATDLASVEQPDLNILMARLDNVASGVEGLTKNLGGDNFNNLLGPFTDFLKENKDRLGAVLGNMQTISSQIAQGQGTVGKLINDDTLYVTAVAAVTNLNASANDIQGILGQAKTAMNQINSGRGTIGKLIQDEKLYGETATAMGNLREIFEKVNRGQGTIGKVVNDETLYRNARMTLQKVDKATEGLEDQGPMSVIGLLSGSLF